MIRQVFVVITIAALASVVSSVCYDQEIGSPADFEFACIDVITDFDGGQMNYYEGKSHKIRITCHSNDWTKWPDVKLNLSSAAEIGFDYCEFPATVNVQNILQSMGVSVIDKIEFQYLNKMLDRKNLKGLSVTEFELSSSEFQELPFDLMYDVMNVNSFVSYNNTLIDIQDSFFGEWAKNLRRVSFQDNKIRKIKKNDFSQSLANLTNLELSNNQITEIESAAFDKLIHLEGIALNSNRLRTLPIGIFQQNNRLSYIDLSRNWFDELPQDLLTHSKHLETFVMNVNYGTLSTLPEMFFGNLSSLKSVSLQNNFLKSVPSNLFIGCSNITSIYLTDNEFVTLPSGLFDDTEKLEYLRISNNFLETLPARIFSKLNRLYYVDLRMNCLTSLLPEMLEGLQSVSEFVASKNNITHIDDQLFQYLQSAHLIDLSHNRITFESNQHEVKLQNTNKSSIINTLENKYAPIVRDQSIHVRHLILSYNNIREFDADVMKLLEYVQHVDLQGNNISQINLSGLPVELMTWNMTLNGKMYSGLKKIDLQDNPFHCNCDIKEFIDQLNGRNGTKMLKNIIHHSKYFKCASPPEMKDRLLKTIRPDELNCPLNIQMIQPSAID